MLFLPLASGRAFSVCREVDAVGDRVVILPPPDSEVELTDSPLCDCSHCALALGLNIGGAVSREPILPHALRPSAEVASSVPVSAAPTRKRVVLGVIMSGFPSSAEFATSPGPAPCRHRIGGWRRKPRALTPYTHPR